MKTRLKTKLLNAARRALARATGVEPPLGTKVLFSVQRALLGEVTGSMRAVAVHWSSDQVEIRVYTHGEVSEEAKEDFDASVVTQVVADFSWPGHGDPAISYSFERCDAPRPLPTWGRYVFARAANS